MGEEESGNSKYAYFFTNLGLIHVEIFNIETKPDFEIKHVVHIKPEDMIPHGTRMFSHSNNVYFVGGRITRGQYCSCLLKFDHHKFQKLPPNTIPSFDFLETCDSKYLPMMMPIAIPSPHGDKTYFLSDTYLHHGIPSAFRFQSFDANNNVFTRLPNPPINRFPTSYDPPHGQFILGSCLYIFVGQPDRTAHIVTFNISSPESSKWKVNEETAGQFQVRNIPAPKDHRGDIGLSQLYTDDNTHIMVALNRRKVIAYRVHIPEGGESFEPISHRVLTEIHTQHPASKRIDGWTHLTNLGNGRFCVVYASEVEGLIFSVFHIDFDEEHEIQTNEVHSGRISSSILSRKEFRLDEDLTTVPLDCCPLITSAFCFLSAHPAPAVTRESPPRNEAD